MIRYSHRDRRAHRAIKRGLATMVAAVLVGIGLAVGTPVAVIGAVAIGGLVAAGLGSVIWGERLFTAYGRDLRSYRSGVAMDGFVRAEIASQVGLERGEAGPTSRSPHVRRRTPPPPGAPGMDRPIDGIGP